MSSSGSLICARQILDAFPPETVASGRTGAQREELLPPLIKLFVNSNYF
jgi:hypothetical protein